MWALGGASDAKRSTKSSFRHIFYLITMKKSIILAALVAAAVPASAQIAFRSEKYINFIPADLTYDNSPKIYTNDDDHNVEIFDASFNLIKNFHLNLPLKKEHVIKESCSNAEVLKISNCEINKYSEIDYMYATSIDDMIGKLKMANGLDFHKITMNDIPGAYSGKMFCSLDENGIIQLHTYDIYWNSTFEFKNEGALTWNLVSEESDEYNANLVYFEYYNLDNSTNYDDEEFQFTQNFFNSDSKWEYVTEKVGAEQLIESRFYVNRFNANGTMIIDRTSRYETTELGYSIINEDGTEVGFIAKPEGCKYFDINDLVVIGNKKYLTADGYSSDTEGNEVYYDYLIDLENLSDVALVVERKDSMRVVSQGDVVEIILPNNAANGEVGIVGMNGQILGRQKVSEGQTRAQFNSANLAKGVYNATFTHKDGKRESQKFIVK
ncbi:MAG: T9SS type A sorting domain-containing protein [Muribaculaceae bacterium]